MKRLTMDEVESWKALADEVLSMPSQASMEVRLLARILLRVAKWAEKIVKDDE